MNLPAALLKKLTLTLLLVASFAITTNAWASGDSGCSYRWKLLHRNYDGCNNMAFLSPSNDTRMNLMLLLADLRSNPTALSLKSPAKPHPDSPFVAWDQLADRLNPTTTKPATTDTPSPTPCPPPLPNDPFTVAINSDHDLTPDERKALLTARQLTQSGCPSDAALSAVSTAQHASNSATARAYALYLQGAAQFWHADYDAAAATFASLSSAQPAWVRETAKYMVARVLINRAQTGAFDEYGALRNGWQADAKIITAAQAALDSYLKQFPNGLYAPSARGLKRRGYWLAKDTARLEEEYGTLLLMSPAERNISDAELIQEIDNKVGTSEFRYASQQDNHAQAKLREHTPNPLLLAMYDLQAMRTAEKTDPNYSGEPATAPITLTELQHQKPLFASQLPLYEYLLAVHAFYVENKPADVLHMIPDATHQGSFNYLQFSRQILRGMALEAVKDHNALGFWKQMLPAAKAPFERPVLELAIAYHQERAGQINDVFAPNSPVHYPYLREILLANIADATLLRTQANNTTAPRHERDLALFTLLYKEATRNEPANFLKDLSLVPAKAPTDGPFTIDDNTDVSRAFADSVTVPAIPLGIFTQVKADTAFGCPTLRATEEQLLSDANNPTAQLCLADFVRLNYAVSYFSTSPQADDLGETPSLFPGDNYVRMTTYTAVLANPKATTNDKAYALYRAINCYGPSGGNACGGKDVPIAQRKAWFTTLKRDYAGSRWANALKYYW